MSQDKRMTANQAKQALHDYYDMLEEGFVESLDQAFKEVFGFGPKRVQRFKERYLELVGERAEGHVQDFAKKLKRRLL